MRHRRDGAPSVASIACPGLRPGRQGRETGAPFEKGAACLKPARRAASSCLRNRSFSLCSRARSRSARSSSAQTLGEKWGRGLPLPPLALRPHPAN